MLAALARGLRGASAATPAQARAEPVVTATTSAATSGTSRPQAWMQDIGFSGPASRVTSLPRVTPVTAQRHATVTACCTIIAGDLAKLPLQVWQRDGTGREVRVRDHAAGHLLNVEAAPGVTAMVTRFAMAYAFALRGTAYAYAPRDGAGELTMIDWVHPDFCSVVRNGRARFYDFEDGEGIRRRAPGRTMIHLRYMAEDSWTGRSPIAVAAESFGIALAGQEAAARSASGTSMKAFAKTHAFDADDENYQRQKERLRRALRDEGENGIPVIGPDDDIKRLDLSAADQQLLESRKFDREQIAAIYRMPPAKLQMLEHGVKANGQQQAIDYRSDCLSHWGGFVESQLALGLLTEAERRAGLFLRHNFDALLRATTKERYDALNKAVGGPWMSLNEARREEGLADVEGGDAIYPPSNMTRDDDATPEKETEE